MNPDGCRFLFKKVGFDIIGCAMDVLNTLGHGFYEKVYEEALIIEFQEKSIRYKQQPKYEVQYKEKPVGLYIPDLIVEDCIIIELKTVDNITDQQRGQVLNYLKVTNLSVAYIFNFKYRKLEWERVINSNDL